MIEVKETRLETFEAAKPILREAEIEPELMIDRLTQSMVIADRKDILGFASYTRAGTVGFIDCVVIADKGMWPSMGDGLVKALLNMMDLRGIKQVYTYVRKDEVDPYKEIGFTLSERNVNALPDELDTPIYGADGGTLMETKLPDFFQTACRSKREGGHA